jgi:hypothetical protein
MLADVMCVGQDHGLFCKFCCSEDSREYVDHSWLEGGNGVSVMVRFLILIGTWKKKSYGRLVHAVTGCNYVTYFMVN